MKTAIVALTLLATLGPPDLSWAQGQGQEQKRVLVLYAVRRDAQVAVVGDRDLPRLLEQGLPQGVDYYSEYIDLVRSPDPEYQARFRDYLQVKYRDVEFDIVIAVLDQALEFARRNRPTLFPRAPIVFLSTNAQSPSIPNGTGIYAPLGLGGTVELAAALQPNLKQVFVVTGASGTDKVYEGLVRAQLAPFEGRLAVTYLAGLPMATLESRVAALPVDSMVFFVMVYQDGAGVNFHPLESLERVARAANAPVYSWVDSAVDRGIVGGRLKDQVLQNSAVATLALKVLRGESADRIPVTAPELHVAQVDWRQLQRWGISESRVPAGTLVKFREPDPWDRYWGYILGATAIVSAQSLLIAGLLVQRTRRRQAEQRSRDLGVRLLGAQEVERARIARELHDDISQQVALLEIDLESLGGAASAGASGVVGGALHRVQGIARSVHDLSHRLHPAKLRLMGLVPALRGLQRELSQSDLEITLTTDNVPSELSPDLTLCLFRVAQEALQNAVKHGQAQNVSIHLSHGAEGLTLVVADDGQGFDVTRGSRDGLGLVSMQERLEAIGGTLAVHSTAATGTRVQAAVPPLVLAMKA